MFGCIATFRSEPNGAFKNNSQSIEYSIKLLSPLAINVLISTLWIIETSITGDLALNIIIESFMISANPKRN